MFNIDDEGKYRSIKLEMTLEQWSILSRGRKSGRDIDG